MFFLDITLLHEPCAWDPDCLVEYSECAPQDPTSLDEIFTCQCRKYYFESNNTCTASKYYISIYILTKY